MGRVLSIGIITLGKKRSTGVQMLVEEYIAKIRLLSSRRGRSTSLQSYKCSEASETIVLYRSTLWPWAAIASVSIKLSSRVLSHRIALLVVIEQLYSNYR